MSNQQTTTLNALKIALRQLQAFGLNPFDWRIERASSKGEVRLYHRFDPDFQIDVELARARSGELLLNNLTVISL